MHAISSSGLVDLWEQGVRLHSLDRNLLVIRAALPDTSRDNPADWPLGRVNRTLAAVFHQHFGTKLQGWVACPQCAEKLEFQMSSAVIANRATDEDNASSGSVFVNGRRFRLPTTRDLARSAGESDASLAALRLLESCQLEGTCPLANDVEDAGEQMALADPLAEIRLAFDCPGCKNQWEENLDLGAFIWSKIEGRAKQLLGEVHTLAAAYGWSENEVLSLSESRRSFYLQLVEV